MKPYGAESSSPRVRRWSYFAACVFVMLASCAIVWQVTGADTDMRALRALMALCGGVQFTANLQQAFKAWDEARAGGKA